MELIVTHVGADFDALASMLAARRLHPDARLFFPGSREESVRRMLESGLVSLDEVRQREVVPAELRRLILVDIRQRDRIGVVADWIAAAPDLDLVIYDHHPLAPGDLAATAGIIDPSVGATSTLLVEELRRRAITLPPEEASVLLMGIYEDTGSLAFATTSPRDLEAARWLLESGGELEHVRRFAVRRLDAEHIDVLHRMLHGLEIHAIRGHRVGLVALDLDRYVEELAPLVNRCLAISQLDLVLALFGEPERVAVIARGEVEGLDLGALLAGAVDGGGHPTAAAASVRGATLTETRESLLAALARELPPAARASDLMLERFRTVPPETTVEEAKKLLNAWKVNAAPVAEAAGRVVGALSRQTLDAALQHGMEASTVERVMATDLQWVPPDAPIDQLADRMVGQHPRFVLVGDPATGLAAGLVTRMSVLRHLHGLLGADPRFDRRTQEARTRTGPALDLLERLPEDVRPRIEAIRRVSRATGAPVYLVGGLVRDLLLGRPNRDVDLVVEGDGPAFARRLAAELGGRAHEHPAFLTAVVTGADGFVLDIATARTESYRAPAALPQVQTSAIRQDLYRRDFTVNTLAIRLGPEERPELIDSFGARRDLEDRRLRVLHSLSFIDDPTRVLRAVRLELRLGFELAPETLRLVEVAVEERVFARLSGGRLREELIAILDDPAIALRGLERLDSLGVLAEALPGLALGASLRERLRQSLAAFDWYSVTGLESPPVRLWRLLLATLAIGLPELDRGALADRLHLSTGERGLLVSLPGRLAVVARALAEEQLTAHQANALLSRFNGEETLLLLGQGDPAVRRWIRRDLLELRGVRIALTGGELMARGVAQGPAIGEALRATRDARLDGRIDGAAELAFALEWVERWQDRQVDEPGGKPSAVAEAGVGHEGGPDHA